MLTRVPTNALLLHISPRGTPWSLQCMTWEPIHKDPYLCAPAADLAKDCTIVFTMLYDDAALEQAVDAFLAAGPPKGTVFTNCATV